jgi:hypothetical protein
VTAVPPWELSQLGLDREHFARADAKSWRGPCPRCGGHRRLLIFTDHAFPKWHCVCESCGLKAWADQLNSAVKAEVSAEQRAEWARRNRAEAEARERYRREKLAEFTSHELWLELAARMTDEHRAWWRSQGVPDEWQQHLRIGYVPQKRYLGQDGESHQSPAYTLPYFHTGFEFVTLQYRLNDVSNPNERYRFEKGLGTTYYQTDPNNPIGPEVIICEGAKKAIVTAVNTPERYTVLAVPSKGDLAGVVTAVKDAERVYVLLDPDAGSRAQKLAAEIGPAARVVTLPVKVDDGFTRHGLKQAGLLAAMQYARPM